LQRDYGRDKNGTWKKNIRDLPVDGEEEWPILDVVKIESIRPIGEGEGAQEGTLIGEESAIDKVNSLSIFCQDIH
jgi:hypothetical protein